MSKKIRPYPTGISWDEALLQRDRADAAEEKLEALREAVAWEMECSGALSEYFVLEDLVGWCNSDAHMSEQLERGYNLVGSKIKTEDDLIKYIKSKKQPIFKLIDEYNK